MLGNSLFGRSADLPDRDLAPVARLDGSVIARDVACGTWDHRDDATWQDSVWPQLERTPVLVAVASRPPMASGAASGCLCPACLAPAAEAKVDRSA
ncbi:hypothetical protein [Jatrophihabitans fulvus]